MHDDPSLVQELLEAGASGYLLKTAGRWELLAAVTTARRSDAVLVSVSRATLLTMATTGKSNAVGILSSREVDVMHHLSVGGSNRAIAVAMGLSEATVKRHLANIYNKLDATSRIDALLKARKNGILVTDGDD